MLLYTVLLSTPTYLCRNPLNPLYVTYSDIINYSWIWNSKALKGHIFFLHKNMLPFQIYLLNESALDHFLTLCMYFFTNMYEHNFSQSKYIHLKRKLLYFVNTYKHNDRSLKSLKLWLTIFNANNYLNHFENDFFMNNIKVFIFNFWNNHLSNLTSICIPYNCQIQHSLKNLLIIGNIL